MEDGKVIRAFIAVEISAAVRAGLAKMQNVLREAGAHASWVKPENIHCTLVFLGDIFESAAGPLAEALPAAVENIGAFDVEIAGLGFFGTTRSPRIVWAGMAGNTGALGELQQKTCEAAEASGLSPDKKPFKPHLTIARVRSNRNAAELVRAIEKNREITFGTITVQRIVLMQSKLTAAGPEYTAIASIPLGKGD
ncbi:MAG: RNA 2',3'-cyclic phosphodiesterase [Kiritimatiellia bacterium]